MDYNYSEKDFLVGGLYYIEESDQVSYTGYVLRIVEATKDYIAGNNCDGVHTIISYKYMGRAFRLVEANSNGNHPECVDPQEDYSDQEKLIIQKCNEVKDLLIRKNRDYGDSAQKSYNKWGNMSFMIRIEDKISRLENLIKNGEANLVKDESLYDTIQDAAGYFLLWMTEMSKKDNKQ